jgi:8-oxo-dGTP diphosphatase
MERLHVAAGILVRDGCVLLVASRYAGRSEPLWHPPGGRQRPGELLHDTAIREVREETGLDVEIEELAYVAESYDGPTHVLYVAFRMHAEGEPRVPAVGDHITAAQFVPIGELEQRISARVVREPLLAYLHGNLPERYRAFPVSDISLSLNDES